MIGLVVCGGQGTRLGPLGSAINKCLLPVRGRPALSWAIDLTRDVGCDRTVLLAGHLIGQIRTYVTTEGFRDVEVLDAGTDSTGVAVARALEEDGSERVVYSHGDIVLGGVARRRLHAAIHGLADSEGLVAVSRRDRAPTHPHAVVERGRVTSFVPARDGARCCVGVASFTPAMLPTDTRRSGALEYLIDESAISARLVRAADIGADWTHLERLDLYDQVR
ncbi:MAG: NTP transferase domain-containing protein [Acidimicrobiales bacterium]|nr:NTP transferase domain-containing protein [Acidimicrobiales bacterium]